MPANTTLITDDLLDSLAWLVFNALATHLPELTRPDPPFSASDINDMLAHFFVQYGYRGQ